MKELKNSWEKKLADQIKNSLSIKFDKAITKTTPENRLSFC